MASNQTNKYIHNTHQCMHRWWWASNGWSVKACTDGQLKQAHMWRKRTKIRVVRQRAMQLEAYHFNTTSIKGKKTIFIHINREKIEIYPRTIMGRAPWTSYFQPDTCCHQYKAILFVYSDFICLWISSSSFSGTCINTPRYFTWSQNCIRTPFRKIFDGTGCL